jgi:hypothetical protein
MGSDFTALLCNVAFECMDPANPVGRRILEWPGDPAPLADNLPLRVAGALHSLARSGRVPALTAVYPPAPMPSAAVLASAVRAAFSAEGSRIGTWLDSPPQTNEVGRSAMLLGGWLTVAAATKMPLSLFEIGSSAGLNLLADRYQYRFGSVSWGEPSAKPLICPDWSGPEPPVAAPLTIVSRRGCDRSPVDLRFREDCDRLLAYVWPDQRERLARLEEAIATARVDPPLLDRADAADWIRRHLDVDGPQGTARILFHSLVWQYLPPAAQREISSHLGEVARAARSESPFAWLRFELGGDEKGAELRLTLWPNGAERLLAVAHPHGNWVRWNA